MIEFGNSTIYEFGDFRFDAKSRRLFRRGAARAVPLQPKVAELLSFLVESGGRVLTKNEIFQAVWENSFVEESNLSQTIFVLRKTLGENTKEPRFILTVPNRGYRFIAPVTEVKTWDKIHDEETSAVIRDDSEKSKLENRKSKTSVYVFLAVSLVLFSAAGVYWFYPTPKPATVSEVKSIAVLPFEDLSAEQTERYLGVSLADALTHKFGSLKQIIVRPTRSVSKYAEKRVDAKIIGRELQVDAVLDGRIQRVGDRLRVSVQLIRTADNATIWTENFDDNFSNFFAVQDSISRKVVSSLALQLDETESKKFNRRGTENAAAYQEYLRGRFFWNKRTAGDLQTAINHFNRAVEIDPNFALSYSALAETYAIYNFYSINYDRDAFPKARIAANRALEIDDELAEAHTALGLVKSQYDFDWEAAEKSYLRAIELNPNYPTARQWFGEFLAFRQRTDESLAQMNRAIELDPTSLSTNAAPALPYLISFQFEKVLEVTDRVLAMDADFAIALHYKARALFRLGRLEEAFEIYRKAIVASNGSMYFKADLGSLYARAGREAEARKILAELHQTAAERHVSPYNFAILYHSLGDRELALDYLRKLLAERDSFVITLPVAGIFETLRDDPQFIEILRGANL